MVLNIIRDEVLKIEIVNDQFGKKSNLSKDK